MKIAIIHLGRKGAGPVYTLEMAKALYALGHEIYYYAASCVENRKIVEEQKFEKRFFDTYNTKLGYLFSVITWIKIYKVIKNIKRDKPDVVYSCMNDLWTPFIFPCLKGVIRVKTIHDVGVHEGNESFFNLWWNNTNFKNAEKYVILSKKFIPKLIEKGIKEDKIVVIPHAGFDYYMQFDSVHKQQSNKTVILFFGRIDQYKGINVLLQSFSLVLEKHPNVVLRIAGNGNLLNEMPLIEKYKESIDLQNRWIKDEEVSSLVSDVAFVVLPYTHATQSGVIPLAYAYSKPVVATNVGCLDEQVINGETGYLCEGSNVKSLADVIIQMLDNPGRTREMGIKANSFMKRYLTWEASAKLLIDFLEK